MVETMPRDFNEHHLTQVPMTENQLGEVQRIEEVAERVGMNYLDTHDPISMAQTADNFLFLWEEAGLAENSITNVEYEGFSETMTPPNPQKPEKPRPLLLSIKNIQNPSAARHLFD